MQNHLKRNENNRIAWRLPPKVTHNRLLGWSGNRQNTSQCRAGIMFCTLCALNFSMGWSTDVTCIVTVPKRIASRYHLQVMITDDADLAEAKLTASRAALQCSTWLFSDMACVVRRQMDTVRTVVLQGCSFGHLSRHSPFRPLNHYSRVRHIVWVAATVESIKINPIWDIYSYTVAMGNSTRFNVHVWILLMNP